MESSLPEGIFPEGTVINEHNFIDADESNGAIFGAGCSSDALDVNRAVQNSTAAALRAIQTVSLVSGTEG
jgi:quinone-modifying oxidoreductase subunit QmoA